MDLTPTTASGLPYNVFHFAGPDGARLAVHVEGDDTIQGSPLVCLPGGPMLDADYLGDLGGLSATRRLLLLDHRGSGASDTPADPAAYRCDRLVEDVEALRRHLGLDMLELLAHSAGANLAYRYAERHPERVARLVLVTPSVRAVGLDVPDEARLEIARRRDEEPSYQKAAAALRRVQAGTATDADWAALTPFSYGRWDDAARAYDARMEQRRNEEAAAAFGAHGAFDPPATRAALSRLQAPVLVVAGELDVGNPPQIMAQVAALFPHGRPVVQPEAGHFPWVDNPDAFRALVEPFLRAA